MSDASFRESPLQTGVKTDSFTGKPTTRKCFLKGYKSERDVKPGVRLFHLRGSTIFYAQIQLQDVAKQRNPPGNNRATVMANFNKPNDQSGKLRLRVKDVLYKRSF